MTTKDYTESLISLYEEKGGIANPDITLQIFQLIANDEDLKKEYFTMKKNYPGINQMIGKTIKEHYDFVNQQVIPVTKDQCELIKNYTRFRKK
jgi:hypothetical protein